ncbi:MULTISPECIES: TIM-barrel domain-containing protein [unclassified Leeuwenhoekiella]|uniref:glycoside hydrolase family 31 protein n=1 Tax=unclassified Leeuwenhoekiella TaxID=2615029 RepID=UPI000C5CD709|nr:MULTISPECIES: TIM-barrel domain-containing protein [unclassified Leeuwenhoekiella]MAW94812.1 xylosidase [Leeuwenhoekiella sp.]MBA79532.1 xylosidase [Leeuwenhoekiella sp.]|tara:strand:- start:27498 stop:29951 length:2454 start_codon:yes stop_codon:yes gene_type:complete
MKSILLGALSAFLICTSCARQSYETFNSGVKTQIDSTNVRIEFVSPSIVRIQKHLEGHPFEKKSLSVIKEPEEVSFGVQDMENGFALTTAELRVELDTLTQAIRFFKPDGSLLLSESTSSFKPFVDNGNKTFTVKQGWTLEADEPIYGLGILQNGKMSQRNQEVEMVQNNTWDFSTFFQSPKGYGVFWDNYSPTTFKDDTSETSFSSQVGDGIDYYVMAGDNADAVIAEMRDLTGEVPMVPLWTYGFWQSRERYKSQDETVGVVQKHRELGVPLDGIIQDWQYWGDNYHWNGMDFGNPAFPDPQKFVDDVHGLNAHLIISIWSSFGPETPQFKELKDKNMLMDFQTWPQSGKEGWPPDMNYPSGVQVYDPYNPEARDIYWEYLSKNLFSLGIDGWWMDSTEPDHLEIKDEDYNNETYLGSFRKVRNAFPLETVGGVYNHQREQSLDKRVFILTRSGFAGQQRYGANVWSGDLGSSWQSLRNQIPAGLNFTLTGNPNFNTDIGGFFAGAYNKSWNDGTASVNPLFQELYVRWMQYGAFTPMMRSHGTEMKREIYHFGEKGEAIYDAIQNAIELRYSLLPYIYTTSWEVTHNQDSFMRALVMDFPQDKKTWDLKDEYMFGDAILVAPVLEAQYTPEKIIKVDEETGWNKGKERGKEGWPVVDFTETKSAGVYLPSGSAWYDYWTNEMFEGGQEIQKETTINTIPLYVKAGSILPIGPEVQYAEEKPWDNLEIRVYEGADGSFSLYEDEFDNYNYENGAYSTISFTWNDASQTLEIADRSGNFDGMLQERKFQIVKIEADGSVSEPQTVSYTGTAVEVKL